MQIRIRFHKEAVDLHLKMVYVNLMCVGVDQSPGHKTWFIHENFYGFIKSHLINCDHAGNEAKNCHGLHLEILSKMCANYPILQTVSRIFLK